MLLTRRRFVSLASAALLVSAVPLFADDKAADPWSASDLITPSALANEINAGKARNIYCVGFPVLYRKKHIQGAQLVGPASKPEGIEELKSATAKLKKDEPLVIYCGCCPLNVCPNVRPAYAALRSAGFTQIRVVNLPTNLRVDWVDKGYPVA